MQIRMLHFASDLHRRAESEVIQETWRKKKNKKTVKSTVITVITDIHLSTSVQKLDTSSIEVQYQHATTSLNSHQHTNKSQHKQLILLLNLLGNLSHS